MKTFLNFAAAALFLFLCFFFAGNLVAEGTAKDTPKFIYTCDCGKKCDCNTVATAPGNCPCGKELKERNILKIEGGKAFVCDCGGGCTCTMHDTDPAACSCGTPIDEVSLKGMYVCACGPECKCNTVSDQPGKCACGKELEKVE